jgi:NOL1/NOP2/fmu family ribosome biogenesis protein
LAEEDERNHLFSWLEERFGISERLFDGYLLFRRNKSWHLLRDTRRLGAASPLKVSRVGLRAFQKVGGFIKPTTRFIQIFGTAATRARLEIGGEQLQRLLAGQEIPLDLDLTKGYVILSLPENRILGLGFFINGKVRSQIPKKELRLAMVENDK